jgi:protein-disulfide isomerase
MTRNGRRFAPFLLLVVGLALGVGLVPAGAFAQDEPIVSDYYPQIGFVVLDQDERRTFIELAESELCPCPGAPRSLSSCLQDLEARCRLAEQVASRMLRLIKEDEPPAQVRDEITRYITDAQTAREFDLASAPRRGPADAPLQVVVFSDFECPYCRRFAETLEGLREELGEQIAIYYLHFPLPQHPNALRAAHAAVAAQNQGRFWQYHDLLFANQARLQSTDDVGALLVELAEEAGLDLEAFRRDLADAAVNQRPLEERDTGRAAGVNSTPTIFINGLKYSESEAPEALREHLSGLL